MTDPPLAPKDQRLCKYRSMEEGTARERTLAILRNCELRYSAASRFNDPFDCHLDIALESTKRVDQKASEAINHLGDALRGVMSALARKVGESMERAGVVTPPARFPMASDPVPSSARSWTITAKEQVDDGRWRKRSTAHIYNQVQANRMAKLYEILDRSFGVLCLSERADDILLWSHYGDSHRGLCLEFNVSAHPDVFPRLHAVKYQQEYPRIPPEFPDLLEMFHDKSDGEITETLLNVADALAHDLGRDVKARSAVDVTALSLAHWFYVKSTRWKYEREWRCLKSKPGPQAFAPTALTRIIVGCADTETTLALVRDAIAGTPVKDVPLYKAVRKARKFGLNIVRAS